MNGVKLSKQALVLKLHDVIYDHQGAVGRQCKVQSWDNICLSCFILTCWQTNLLANQVNTEQHGHPTGVFVDLTNVSSVFSCLLALLFVYI